MSSQVLYATAVSQLQDTEAKLAAEKEECRNTKRRAEFLDKELQALKQQLENIATSLDHERQRCNKYEVK